VHAAPVLHSRAWRQPRARALSRRRRRRRRRLRLLRRAAAHLAATSHQPKTC
jgi:hypothetical protein